MAHSANVLVAERQENLATVCSRYNVNCLRIASGMFIPESDDIAATEPQSDGSTLMLLNADKASGNVQCGSSVALWSLAGGSGDRTFDGRDQNGVKNTRISGYFSSDPSKKVRAKREDKLAGRVAEPLRSAVLYVNSDYARRPQDERHWRRLGSAMLSRLCVGTRWHRSP